MRSVHFLPHCARAAFLAMFRLALASAWSLWLAPVRPLGLTGTSSDSSPVEMATMRLARWFTSRGRAGVWRRFGIP